MTTIYKIQEGRYLLQNNTFSINTLFSMWKIWLSKKEIALIYWVKKSDIKKELNKIALNSNLDLDENILKVYNDSKGKNEKFYSLDILLLLGYNSKHYKETKLLVNTNKLLKEYTANRKYQSNRLPRKSFFNKLSDYFHAVA